MKNYVVKSGDRIVAVVTNKELTQALASFPDSTYEEFTVDQFQSPTPVTENVVLSDGTTEWSFSRRVVLDEPSAKSFEIPQLGLTCEVSYE